MIYELGDFPYFTRGTTPNAYGGWRIIDINVPIYLLGHLCHYVTVNPGDFIFSDDDGLQVVPEPYVDEMLLRREETYAGDQEPRHKICAGEISFDQVYAECGDL